MPDDYTNTMRDHFANCYQAHGLSSTGAEQLANNQNLSNPVDQKMMGAYSNQGANSPLGNEAGTATNDQVADYGVPSYQSGPQSVPDKYLNEGGTISSANSVEDDKPSFWRDKGDSASDDKPSFWK